MVCSGWGWGEVLPAAAPCGLFIAATHDCKKSGVLKTAKELVLGEFIIDLWFLFELHKRMPES